MTSHYVLRIVYFNQPPETRTISAPTTTIGRESGDIVLGDPQSSGRHASLEFRGGQVVVRDLGSTNGTWVDGQRITELVLAAGGWFQIGQSSFQVLSIQMPPQAPSPNVARTMMGVGPAGMGIPGVTRPQPAAAPAVAPVFHQPAAAPSAAAPPHSPLVAHPAASAPANPPAASAPAPAVHAAPAFAATAYAPVVTASASPPEPLIAHVSQSGLGHPGSAVPYPTGPAAAVPQAGFGGGAAVPPGRDVAPSWGAAMDPPPTGLRPINVEPRELERRPGRHHTPRESAGAATLSLDAQSGDIFGPYLIGMLLSMVTFGIYAAWFICRLQSFLAERTTLTTPDGEEVKFEFTGRGGDLFVRSLIGLLLTIVTMGIYAPWFIVDLTQFYTDNLRATSRSGATYRVRYDGRGGRLFWVYFINNLLVSVTFGIYFPWFLCKLSKEMLSQMVILRSDEEVGGLDFVGEGESLIGQFLLGALLCLVTLGIYFPWFIVKIMRFMRANTRVTIDEQPYSAEFSGTGGRLFVLMLLGAVVPFTLLLLAPYHWLAMSKFRLNSTSFAPVVPARTRRALPGRAGSTH